MNTLLTHHTPIDKKDWIAGLDKGLAMLQTFDEYNPRLTATQAGQRCGLTRTAARRYLLTLLSLGFVASDGKLFWLTPKVMRLGQSYLESVRLPRIVQPSLQRLAMGTQEISFVAVLDGYDLVYIARNGQNHPQTQRSETELATLKAQLDTETRKITSSIETTYQVSKQREQQLQGAVAGQKARVLILNKQRDELNVLRRDIESAQRAFEMVSQRASQSNIESQTNQTNILVLNPAVPPTDPSKPRLLLNILVSIFLGTLLGVGLALVLELANRRVRSGDDLVDALGLPLLGSISSASGMLKRNTGTGANA